MSTHLNQSFQLNILTMTAQLKARYDYLPGVLIFSLKPETRYLYILKHLMTLNWL